MKPILLKKLYVFIVIFSLQWYVDYDTSIKFACRVVKFRKKDIVWCNHEERRFV